MERFVFIIVVLLFLGLVAPCRAAAGSGIVTMEFDLSGHPSAEEMRLWTPYPVSDADQLIGDIEIKGDYTASGVYTDPVHGNPILFAFWGKDAQSRKLTFSFSAERKEIVRRDFPAKEVPWDPADYKPYLTATRLGPTGGKVKELADEITRGKETVLEKAKAVYDWTCRNMYRDPGTRGCGTGDVCSLLEKPGGKCTDISSVFVALARASGVPAREIFGLRLGKKPEEDITGFQHCWAEFYLPGYGWVPVDPADVRKAMLAENLKPEEPKTAEVRAYYWGGIDAYRMKLSTGRDVTLNPPHAGEPLNTFGYPFAQIGDRTIDWLDASSFKYRIVFREQ